MMAATLLRGVGSDRIAAVLGCGVSAAMVDRLVQSPRLRERTAKLIALKLGDVGSLRPEQVRALAMRPDELIELADRAGVIWHAGAIVRLISVTARRLLIERLGEKNYALSLIHHNLQPSGVSTDREPEDIAKAVRVDGPACLAVWCEAQPLPVRERLRLTRPDASPEPIHEMWGQPIILRLLADR